MDLLEFTNSSINIDINSYLIQNINPINKKQIVSKQTEK